MPRTAKPGWPDSCYLCGGGAGTLHHTSYEPEEVILVCASCHCDVHAEGYGDYMRYPELLPDKTRNEWIAETFDVQQPPDLSPEQVSWDDEGHGVVHR